TASALADVPGPGGTYGDAIRWYARAAEAGSARAQYLLGVKYETGVDVDRDLDKALAWYRKAAEQDYAEAQFKLGVMHEQGRGMPQDLAAAVSWYLAAARNGLPAAQYNLGVALLNGSGVAPDPVEAFAWVLVAAGGGLGEAARLRDQLLTALPTDIVNLALSRSRAIKAGLPGGSGAGNP
ncbi:MAG: tetratricopeptide repeat protein, partial [Alphaproteobacteria bacterium]